MHLSLTKPKGLTASQKRNLAALITGGLLALNEHWPQVTALVGQHYPGLPIPPGVSLVLMLASYGVTSLSRALNRAKSGTGTGIVGDAPPATEAPALPPPNVALRPPSLPAAVTGLVVDDLLGLALKRLPPGEAQAVKAFAVQKLSDMETEAAKNMTGKFRAESLASLIVPAPPVQDRDAAAVAVKAGTVSTGGAQIVQKIVQKPESAPPTDTVFVDGESEPTAAARAQALTEQGVLPVVTKNADGTLSVTS